MKKLLTIILALIMSVGIATVFTACGQDHEHTYSNEWSTDGEYHWKKATCEHTDKISEKAAHSYGDDLTCDICRFVSNGLTLQKLTSALEGFNSNKIKTKIGSLQMTSQVDGNKFYYCFDDMGSMYFIDTDWTTGATTMYAENYDGDTNEFLGWSVDDTTMDVDMLQTIKGYYDICIARSKVLLRKTASGQDITIEQAYASFVYNESENVYKATLYGSLDNPPELLSGRVNGYITVNVSLYFDGEKVSKIIYDFGTSYQLSFTYGETITLPQVS